MDDLPDLIYDVNKCSHCVGGNHDRCHGPCNCEHQSEPDPSQETPEELVIAISQAYLSTA